MDRCPFRPSPQSICRVVGAQHKLGDCQCVRAGFDHLDHIADCGSKWTTAATSSQIDALRVIAAHPGIKAMAFSRIRHSRGQTFRRLEDLGLIVTSKAKTWAGAQAFVTPVGARACEELIDMRQPAAR